VDRDSKCLQEVLYSHVVGVGAAAAAVARDVAGTCSDCVHHLAAFRNDVVGPGKHDMALRETLVVAELARGLMGLSHETDRPDLLSSVYHFPSWRVEPPSLAARLF